MINILNYVIYKPAHVLAYSVYQHQLLPPYKSSPPTDMPNLEKALLIAV